MASPPLTRREYAYFSVAGQGNHDKITERLGIEPSQAWSEGDIRRSGGTYPCARWRFDSGLPDTEPLEKHISALLDRLQACPAAVRSLAPDYSGTIQCVGYYPATGHGVHIDHRLVKSAAHLGLQFDLDFYFLSEHGHDG
jgi:hypothetical protein